MPEGYPGNIIPITVRYLSMPLPMQIDDVRVRC